MTRLFFASILFLSACGIGLDAHETGLPVEQDGEVGILSLDPSWGHPDEDTIVTITGWGLEGDIAIQFGNADLQVTRVSEDSIVVTAPAIGFETAVDMERGLDELIAGLQLVEVRKPYSNV